MSTPTPPTPKPARNAKPTGRPAKPAAQEVRRVRCELCRSHNVYVASTQAPVRYYKCRNCGRSFKVVVV